MVTIYYPTGYMPNRHTDLAAGYDIRSYENAIIKPGEWKLIRTNLYSSGTSHSERLDIRPRSGLAYKHGITVLNSPGTIDADYSGEIGILLINHGTEDFRIAIKDRIAQMIIISDGTIRFIESDDPKRARELEANEDRGGFGHTGVK